MTTRYPGSEHRRPAAFNRLPLSHPIHDNVGSFPRRSFYGPAIQINQLSQDFEITEKLR